MQQHACGWWWGCLVHEFASVRIMRWGLANVVDASRLSQLLWRTSLIPRTFHSSSSVRSFTTKRIATLTTTAWNWIHALVAIPRVQRKEHDRREVGRHRIREKGRAAQISASLIVRFSWLLTADHSPHGHSLCLCNNVTMTADCRP